MSSDIIRVVLPVALVDVFAKITPLFEQETGFGIEPTVMLNPEVADYVLDGAEWSIAFSNPAYIKKIVHGGKAATRGLQNFGYSPLCFATRGEQDLPELCDADGITGLLRRAESIALTQFGTSGAQFHKLAADLSLTDDLQPKLHLLPGGGPMAALHKGEVEIAALPLTNVAPVAGVFAKAVAPREMDVHIDLAYCLAPQANVATQTFAKWLESPQIRDRLIGLGIRGLG